MHRIPTLAIILTIFSLPLMASAMSLGTRGDDVRSLQSFLNASGYTVTNYGEETTYFGPATEAALVRFQSDHAEYILGGEGVLNNLGTLDPLTKRYLQSQGGEVLGATTVAPFTTNLFPGRSHPDVKRLQKFLNTKGYTVAMSGPGSKGLETAFYGPATKAAVTRYQEAYTATILIPNNLTKGTGLFLTSTRAQVNTDTTTATADQGGVILAAAPTTGSTRTLTITLSVGGTVNTSTGLTCSISPCVFTVPDKTHLNLTATPNTGNVFSQWGGNCSGTTPTCSVTMARDRSVSATFTKVTNPDSTPTPTHTLTTAVSGVGTITSSPTGISCGTDCTESYTENTSVTLTAIPATGYTFIGWSGACTTTSTTCTILMTSAQDTTASFAAVVTPVNGACGSSNGGTFSTAPSTNLCSVGTASSVTGSGPWYWSCAGQNDGTTASCSAALSSTNPTVYALTVAQPSNGTVTGAGISCGTDCTESYNSGTSVTLTATPSSDYTFSGWGGACSGTASTCTVSMTASRSVSATFTANVTPINGACGSSNGGTFSTAPSTNLCSVGTASSVTGSGPWYWSCAGQNDGTTASCSAALSSTNPPPTGGSGPTYYFSDCQSGAASSCVPGNNANAGTSASAPKQNLSGINLNAYPAGTTLLFARGGVWNSGTLFLQNLNVTTASPLTFDAYGSGSVPWFKFASGQGLEFGTWNNTSYDGGYVIRNLKLDGQGTSNWGFWLRDHMHDLLVENVEITGFAIGIHTQSAAYVANSAGVNKITLRNVNVHHNSDMGFLGKMSDSVIEDSLFESNNFSGSGFSHAIYWSGGHNNTLRNNTFRNNSVANGVCTGGNVTFHGQFDTMLIENNTITQVSSSGGCYGFSITSGYSTAEWFRNFTVRGNTIVNLGYLPIVAHAAPNIIIENNRVKNTQTIYQDGVNISANDGDTAAGDDVTTNAIIRNNTVCSTNGTGYPVRIVAPATGTESGTIYQTGAAATTGSCAF